MGDDDGAEAPAPPPKKLKHELTLVLHPILPPLKKLTRTLVITEPFSADELSQLVRAATHEDGSTSWSHPIGPVASLDGLPET